MQNVKLYNKYLAGQHWYNHPTQYAHSYINFLRSKEFSGVVLDIGSGSGRDVHEFSKAGYKVFGLDISKAEIEAAEKNFPHERFILGDAERLTLEDASIDAVFMINVAHYVDQKKAMAEVYRVLKNHGYFFIHFNIKIEDADGNIDYEQDEDEIRERIKTFTIIKEEKLTRLDTTPTKHMHDIVQFILQK